MIFFNEWFVGGLIVASILFWAQPSERLRNPFIIVASGLALASIQPIFTGILAGLILLTHLLARSLMPETEGRGRRLTLSICLLAVFLLSAKYGGLFFRLVFSAESALAKSYLVPLGTSYLCFKLIAYVIDVYRGQIKDPQLVELFAFIFFVPTFPAGPIERYQNFAGQRSVTWDSALYVDGLRRLALGYFKKVVIVNFFLGLLVTGHLYPAVMNHGVPLDLPAWKILAFLISALIFAYVDLSAYADIAIGYGQLFGYRTTENMNYPLLQRNLSDYWSCWHISLSSWCRNNVYFPILGATRKNTPALYASFIVMGLWHNISFNWFIWGLWHATGITVYSSWNRYLRRRKPLRKLLRGRLGHIGGALITCLYSALGFAFIMTDSRTDLIGATTRAVRILLAIVL